MYIKLSAALDGTALWVASLYMEALWRTGDATEIAMQGGHKLLVKETPEEIFAIEDAKAKQAQTRYGPVAASNETKN